MPTPDKAVSSCHVQWHLPEIHIGVEQGAKPCAAAGIVLVFMDDHVDVEVLRGKVVTMLLISPSR